MDLLRDDGASIEKDRISNLPDDIIHRILSFLDMRYAIRTCILSRRWKNTWTSMPYINLNSYMYMCMFKPNLKFEKFVDHVLTHRNNRTEVFEVELTFDDQTDQMCVADIVHYAYLHNARKLTVIWSYLFGSRSTLKHLTLEDDTCNFRIPYLPESAWGFPALETLKLSNIWIPGNKCVNLYSKCVNLKDLTLHGVYMHGREIFNVCAPQLLNLTITNSVTFPEVFNVVAPRLKNLTASLSAYPYKFRNGAPLFLPLSTDGFNSLEKVNLSFGLGKKKERQ